MAETIGKTINVIPAGSGGVGCTEGLCQGSGGSAHEHNMEYGRLIPPFAAKVKLKTTFTSFIICLTKLLLTHPSIKGVCDQESCQHLVVYVTKPDHMTMAIVLCWGVFRT